MSEHLQGRQVKVLDLALGKDRELRALK